MHLMSSINKHLDELFVVTGANKGIGWQVARLLASEGASLVLGARNQSEEFTARCEALNKEFNTSVTLLQLDLDSAESIRDFVIAVKKCGQITGLVNNAGVTHNSLFQMSTIDNIREVFETNYFGLVQLSQGLVKLLARGKRGSIVNISSSAAVEANVGKSIYGASKAAVSTMTKAMARELAAQGIRVNAVAPGITETDMVAESMTEGKIAEVVSSTSLRRMAQPREIANAVSFLLSQDASYVSGIVLKVDGGLQST